MPSNRNTQTMPHKLRQRILVQRRFVKPQKKLPQINTYITAIKTAFPILVDKIPRIFIFQFIMETSLDFSANADL